MARTSLRDRLAAMEQLAEFLEPYGIQDPSITVAEALQRHIQACKPTAASQPWEKGGVTIMCPAKKAGRKTAHVAAQAVHISDADILGPLAVFPLGEHFSVTHRPTGFCIANLPNREQAMRMAEMLASLDWAFDKPEDVPAETIRAAYPFRAAAHLGCFPAAAPAAAPSSEGVA